MCLSDGQTASETSFTIPELGEGAVTIMSTLCGKIRSGAKVSRVWTSLNYELFLSLFICTIEWHTKNFFQCALLSQFITSHPSVTAGFSQLRTAKKHFCLQMCLEDTLCNLVYFRLNNSLAINQTIISVMMFSEMKQFDRGVDSTLWFFERL